MNLSSIKQLVKKVLPQPVLQAVLQVRDENRLRMVSSLPFDPRNLKTQDELGPAERFFAKSDAEDAWKEDHKRISAMFGDKDTFGGVNPGDRRALYSLIRALNPKNVLEVGTHIGASTLYLASALSDAGKLTTVDIIDVNDDNGPWKKYGAPACPRDLARKLGVDQRIEFHASPSLEFMKGTDKRFDLIFLDGDHSSHAVYAEVSAALPLLSKGGIIILHDYYPGGRALFPDGNIIHGPYLAMRRVMEEYPAIQAVPLGELPWPTKQGSRFTSLALVTRRS